MEQLDLFSYKKQIDGMQTIEIYGDLVDGRGKGAESDSRDGPCRMRTRRWGI